MRHSGIVLAYIYDVLVKEAGALDEESDKNTFVQAAIDWDYKYSFEYRFMGSLGFGGKIRLPLHRYPHVTCYPEDETPERKSAMEKTNSELKRLIDEQGGRL
jgi:hypothetical protein